MMFNNNQGSYNSQSVDQRIAQGVQRYEMNRQAINLMTDSPSARGKTESQVLQEEYVEMNGGQSEEYEELNILAQKSNLGSLKDIQDSLAELNAIPKFGSSRPALMALMEELGTQLQEQKITPAELQQQAFVEVSKLFGEGLDALGGEDG